LRIINLLICEADDDEDTFGNVCDTNEDKDRDGVPDTIDNCPDNPNADQVLYAKRIFIIKNINLFFL